MLKQKSTAAGVITALLLYIRKPKTVVQYSLRAMIFILCRRSIQALQTDVCKSNQKMVGRCASAALVAHKADGQSKGY